LGDALLHGVVQTGRKVQLGDRLALPGTVGVEDVTSCDQRLDDPGLARDQYYLPMAIARAVDKLAEGITLRYTADQYRADDLL
jgi:hypothetical protein